MHRGKSGGSQKKKSTAWKVMLQITKQNKANINTRYLNFTVGAQPFSYLPQTQHRPLMRQHTWYFIFCHMYNITVISLRASNSKYSGMVFAYRLYLILSFINCSYNWLYSYIICIYINELHAFDQVLWVTVI